MPKGAEWVPQASRWFGFSVFFVKFVAGQPQTTGHQAAADGYKHDGVTMNQRQAGNIALLLAPPQNAGHKKIKATPLSAPAASFA